MLLAYELHGPTDAPATVLIHGITESRHSWRPITEALAPSHRVLAVDLRGHGQSEAGDSYDPISYASDVVETMQHVGLRQARIVGHSLGGVVASAVGALGAATSIVNVDQPLRLAAFKEGLMQLEPMLRSDEATFRSAMAMVFSAMDGELPASERARIADHARPDQSVVLATWDGVFTSTPEELDATVEQLASAVKVPYLSLHGIDPGSEYGDWLVRVIPTATVEVWAGQGHYPHLVSRERFLSRLARG